MRERHVVGAVVALSQGNEPPIELALGLADADTNRPMTTDCSFRIAGSKVFLGTALLQIAGEKKVSLDDPISKYVNGVPNGDRITLRHLGSQRSGLFNHIQAKEVKKAFADEPQRSWKLDELLEMAFKNKSYGEPGITHHYANANTVLLAKVIEKATGNSWQDEMRKRILEPLGMKQTNIVRDNTLPMPRAEGYAFGNDEGPFFHRGPTRFCVTNTSPTWFGPATAIVSTLADIRKCVKPLATGALLTPEMRKELQAWTPADQEGYEYGFHIEKFRGFIGHDGDMPGYQTAMYYSPQLDATIIALTNVYGWSFHDMPADRLVWNAAETVLKVPPLPKESRENTLHGKLDSRRGEMDCPGALVQIQTGDQPPRIFELGVADVKSMKPMLRNAHMRIASVSKVFLGTTVLLLADDKKLSLDDPISKYVDGVPAGDKITLRQLGNNTSGIFNSIGNRDFQDAIMKEPGKIWPAKEILQYAFAKPAPYPPGGRFFYSNSNAVLLGLAIEKVTGKPYSTVIAQRVLQPLRLNHTGVSTGKLPDPCTSAYRHGYENRVIGYGKTFYDVSHYSGGWAGAAGNMYSTLDDLTRACKPLATGQLLSAAGKAELHRWVDTGHDGIEYGFGLGKRRGALGHTGDVPGYQAVVQYIPAGDTTIVTLTNLSNNKDGTMPAEELATLVRENLTEK